MNWSLINQGSVSFRGSYDQVIDHAVERGIAEFEPRMSQTGEAVDRIRLASGVHITLTASEARFCMRRAA